MLIQENMPKESMREEIPKRQLMSFLITPFRDTEMPSKQLYGIAAMFMSEEVW